MLFNRAESQQAAYLRSQCGAWGARAGPAAPTCWWRPGQNSETLPPASRPLDVCSAWMPGAQAGADALRSAKEPPGSCNFCIPQACCLRAEPWPTVSPPARALTAVSQFIILTLWVSGPEPCWFANLGVLGTRLPGAGLKSWGAPCGIQTLAPQGDPVFFSFLQAESSCSGEVV